jgi:hypothetical protein
MTMRRRTRITPEHDPRWAEWFAWACDDTFTTTFFGGGFPSVDAAREAWQHCRREVWAETHRFTLPRAAEVFDGLSSESVKVVRNTWNYVVFPLERVHAALEADRAALAAFRRTPAADAIADYLALFAADLEQVERTAAALAASDATHPWQRPYPDDVSSAHRYGREFGAGATS